MSDVDAIVAFIECHLSEDELVARNASRYWAWPTPTVPPTRTSVTTNRYTVRFDPDHTLRQARATRALIAEVMSWGHFYLDEGAWYSCSQAVDPSERHAEPGSGCLDDERRGKPCDCGLDRRRMAILVPIATLYHGRIGWCQEWGQPC